MEHPIHRPSPRNWEEDFPEENGNYQHICFNCRELFVGLKGRLICKLCDEKAGVNHEH